MIKCVLLATSTETSVVMVKMCLYIYYKDGSTTKDKADVLSDISLNKGIMPFN